MEFNPFQFEEQTLAPYAVFSRNSLGREFQEVLSNNRTCFQRDRDRVIHSAAFRRLNGKTQVFIANASDHYRSRLTHSIEVSQVSRHLARLLNLNEDLAETIALAHDLGHTPFGHAGERMLNKLMSKHGGFEHNKQSRRVVDHVEQKYPEFNGLNLSKEVRDGLLKHQSPWDQPEASVGFISIEAQIVNLSDEIAYNNHDIDDGLYSGILNEEELISEVPLFAEAYENVSSKYKALSFNQRRHCINRYLISKLIDDVAVYSAQLINDYNIKHLEDVQSCTKPLVSFSPLLKKQCSVLRKFLFHKFYRHKHIAKMNQHGKDVIEQLFNLFDHDPSKLPAHIFSKLQVDGKYNVIADYISGMTDAFAINQLEHFKLAQ